MQVRTRCFQSLDYEDLCRVHDAARLQEMKIGGVEKYFIPFKDCLLYTSPSPRDVEESRMPSSA